MKNVTIPKRCQTVLFGITIAFISLVGISTQVFAEETVISVSDNGSTSQNAVSSQNSSNTKVQQSNDAKIENTVHTSSQTGENQASDNTGKNTHIQTGDSVSSTTVVNDSVNTNVAKDTNCNCPQDTTSVKIHGNGSNSQNTVATSNNSSQRTIQQNEVSITNKLKVRADTGNNTANDNSGNTLIQTGDIRSTTQVQNSRINFSIDSQGNTPSKVTVDINGNGSGSVNKAVATLSQDNTTLSENFVHLVNDVVQNLNTGTNFAKGNNGEVAVITGNILSSTQVINQDINTNIANHACACNVTSQGPPEKSKPPVGGVPPNQPSPSQPTLSTSLGGGPGASRVTKTGAVLGASIGGILPVTGSYWLFMAMIANIVMFFLGWYLRLRSGRSPGFAFAFSL